MKTKFLPINLFSKIVTLSCGFVVAGLVSQPAHASLWTGAAADNNWDNLSNWDSNPSGGIGQVDTLTAYPIITGANTIVPNDLKIAAADPSSTGRVDIRSGSFKINYWGFVGDWGGNATLNLADTSTSGGTYTGFGTGSGSFTNTANGNGNFMVGLYNSTGVVNMNTSGSLNVTELRLSPNGQAGSATFNLDNGSVNVAGSFAAGSDFWGANTNSPAYLNMSGGSITTGWEFWIGGSGTGTGTMTGGTINSGAWFVVGRNDGSNGTFTMSGGTVNAATTQVGSFPVVGSFGGSQGTLNVSGGLFTTGTTNRKLFVGENGAGTLNISGSGSVVINNNVTGDGFRLGVYNGSSGTVNLNGGTLEVAYVAKGTGTGNFNFNGGTLKVGSNHDGTNAFMSGLTNASVLGGGAVIDTNGNSANVLISQALLDGGGGGGLTKTGTGTLTLSGANAYTGPTDVNAGTLVVNGSIGSSSLTTVDAGAKLMGTGRVGDTTVNGTLAPGNSIGRLIIDGDLVLAGVSDFEIDPDGVLADLADVSGSLTYGGTLNVGTLAGSTGTYILGQTYDLFDFASASGTFANVYLPDISGLGLAWSKTQLYTDGLITVVPEPATTLWLTLLFSGALLRRRRHS